MGEPIIHSDKLHERRFPSDSWFTFYCPGCKHGHHYEVPRWSFNGNYDKPTFAPSLRMFTPQSKDPVDGTAIQEKTICHLHLRDGRIEFCNDCDHDLKGQTVDMVPFPEGYGT